MHPPCLPQRPSHPQSSSCSYPRHTHCLHQCCSHSHLSTLRCCCDRSCIYHSCCHHKSSHLTWRRSAGVSLQFSVEELIAGIDQVLSLARRAKSRVRSLLHMQAWASAYLSKPKCMRQPLHEQAFSIVNSDARTAEARHTCSGGSQASDAMPVARAGEGRCKG